LRLAWSQALHYISLRIVPGFSGDQVV
jgi:hypothetical protein